MEKISILMPFKSDNGPREEIFKWTVQFYETMFPKAEICIGSNDSDPFNKSKAVNNAAKIATGDIYVIADADIIYDPSNLKTSIELLKNHSWIVPYFTIKYLTKDSTVSLLKTSPKWPLEIYVDGESLDLSQWDVTGGINILSRKNFEEVGGFDTRFEGWGREDDAFGFAMNTLCGPCKRIHSNIFHLWHPTEKERGNPKFHINKKLYNLYASCIGNKTAMRNLIDNRDNNIMEEG